MPSYPSVSISSPTEYWSSNNIKNPVIRSFTRDCAPKPMANPPIPAVARIDLVFTPNKSSAIITPINTKK